MSALMLALALGCSARDLFKEDNKGCSKYFPNIAQLLSPLIATLCLPCPPHTHSPTCAKVQGSKKELLLRQKLLIFLLVPFDIHLPPPKSRSLQQPQQPQMPSDSTCTTSYYSPLTNCDPCIPFAPLGLCAQVQRLTGSPTPYNPHPFHLAPLVHCK